MVAIGIVGDRGWEPSSVDATECLADDSLLKAFEKLHFLVADRRGLATELASVAASSTDDPRRSRGARTSSFSGV
jgi:hypothetical protein